MPDFELYVQAINLIPNPDLPWGEWKRVIMAIWATFLGNDDGLAAAHAWSRKSSKKYDTAGTDQAWDEVTGSPPSDLSAATLIYMADQASPGWRDAKADEPLAKVDSPSTDSGVGERISLEDFVSYLPEHNYIYMRARAYWPGSSVNARLPRVRIGVKEDGTPITISPSEWLDRYRRVEVQTWMPGEPTLIKGHEFTEDDGLKPHADSNTFNLYKPPTIKLGDPAGAQRWLDLIEELYPDDKDHIVRCFAHVRQHPHVKINHVLFLGGDQGIGKDTIFAGLERGVGFSNFRTVTPSQIIESAFNGEFKTVVLYISEVHDLGIRDRIKFYNVMKDKLAVPPTNIRINEKYRQPYYIPNLLFAVMTSNFQTGGIYLPPNDRRRYVGWSAVKKGNHPEEWWRDYYRWLDGGGDECIAGYLQAYDLSDFDPKAEPIKTEAWHTMVNASRSSEELELTDVLERFNNGAATLVMIRNAAIELRYYELARWLGEAKNHKAIAERLEAAGYTIIRNPDETTKGRWRVLQVSGSTTPRAIYGPSTLELNERLRLARALKDVKEPEQREIPM